MATGWPMKTTYANGDVYSASDVNDITGTVNLLQTSTLSSSAGKNVIINGGLDIWQRGTSSTTNGVYLADRWFDIAIGTTTISRDTDVPSGVPVQYSIKWVTSAASSFGQFFQMIEQANVIPLRNQVMTQSVYVKTTGSYSGNLVLKIEYNTTSDTYAGGTWVLLNEVAFAGSSVTSWTRKTNTVTVPSNAVGLRYSLVPDAAQGSGISVFMTGAQFERGSYATTFSRAGGTIQGELAACQRYYLRYSAGVTAYSIFATNAWSFATTTGIGFFAFPVEMRIAPASMDSSNLAFSKWDNLHYALSSLVLETNISTNKNAYVYGTMSGGPTGGTVGYFGSNNSSSGYIGFSAEL